MNRLKEDLYWFIQCFLNHFVTHIPCWTIRKLFYRLAGMKIGRHSRICMGTTIEAAHKIQIGSNTYINEFCRLAGGGGIIIGDNVNISNYSVIISGSHDIKSPTFAWRGGAVYINDYVWLGTRATVLDRSRLAEGVVLSAGSVIKGDTDAYGVYQGIPAKRVKDRVLKDPDFPVWKPIFI